MENKNFKKEINLISISEGGQLITVLKDVNSFMLLNIILQTCDNCGEDLHKSALLFQCNHIVCNKCFKKSPARCTNCGTVLTTIIKINKQKKIKGILYNSKPNNPDAGCAFCSRIIPLVILVKKDVPVFCLGCCTLNYEDFKFVCTLCSSKFKSEAQLNKHVVDICEPNQKKEEIIFLIKF